MKFPVSHIGVMLALPKTMKEYGEKIKDLTEPALDNAPIEALVTMVTKAAELNHEKLIASVAPQVLDCAGPNLGTEQLMGLCALLAKHGCEMDFICSVVLLREDAAVEELTNLVTILADKKFESDDFAKIAEKLGSFDLSSLTPAQLLQIVLAATKSASVQCLAQKLGDAVATRIKGFDLEEVCKLFLACAFLAQKAEVKLDAVFLAATDMLKDQLSTVNVIQLIKIAVAASKVAVQGSDAAHRDLLEACAVESVKRMSEILPPQMLVLSQALITLGGEHKCLREILEFVAGSIPEAKEDADEVTKMRLEMEKNRRWKCDELARLMKTFESAMYDDFIAVVAMKMHKGGCP